MTSESQSRISGGITQIPQNIGELVGEDLLPRVWLGAFPVIAGAVVAHVPALLQFADEQATTMAAVD